MGLATTQTHVGRTKLVVSKLGLGTAPLQNKDTAPDDPQRLETVRYALAQGINLIDTAPLYGAGKSEICLSIALADIPRDSYVLSSKVGRLVQPNGTVSYDYSRDGILRSFEESLNRLKIGRIDILHIHDADNHYRQALDEAFPTLAELRSQGVITAIGAGMNQWQMLGDFARNADFDCFLLAGRYTLLEQTAVEEFLPLIQQKGIGLFLGGVYNSGILATGPTPGATYNYAPAPPEIAERVRRIEAVCARYGVPLNVAALQFPLAHPAVTALLVGAQAPSEVEANIKALDYPIPAALWNDLRAEGLIHEVAPAPSGGGR